MPTPFKSWWKVLGFRYRVCKLHAEELATWGVERRVLQGWSARKR
ncbi:hypothetical protein ACQZV8_19285 [Magnetococcales bacterium HHB-1]